MGRKEAAGYPRVYQLMYQVPAHLGVYLMESNNRLKQRCYRSYMYVMYCLLAVLVMQQMLSIPNIEDEDFRIFSLALTTLAFLVLVKGSVMFHNYQKIKDLQAALQNNLDSGNADPDIVASESQDAALLMKFYYYYCTVCYMGLFFGVPLVINLEPYWYPIPLSWPFEYKHPVRYVLCYVFEIFMASFGISIFLSHTTILSGLIQQMTAQYRILYRILAKDSVVPSSTVGKQTEEEQSEVLMKLARDCVRYHHAINQKVKILDDIFNKSLLCHVVSLTLTLCLIGYHLTMLPFSHNSALCLMTVVVLLIDLLILSVFATRLQTRSEDVSFAAYSSPWYTQNRQYRRQVALLIQGTQHPPSLTIGTLFNIDTEMFLSIMKLTYNAMAMLKEMTS